MRRFGRDRAGVRNATAALMRWPSRVLNGTGLAGSAVSFCFPAAEWAREPTDAELGGYLPPGAPEGSGLIACKTIPGNRVDDCVEIGNDPPGSHLARAVRLAAWQFHVRPPRKNGRPMIGEWVRIRIDYYHTSGQ